MQIRDEPASPAHLLGRGNGARLFPVVGALGVVFGDIGTSPIYTIQTVFNPTTPHPVPMSTQHVYGVVSLIFWTLMLIVTLTYVTLVMRADNDGEGGIMALITMVTRWGRARGDRTALALAGLGIFGAALFIGDSMVTPAISVLSAVEGLKVLQPELAAWVVPITVVIIVVLFSVQRHGTGTVGRLFGPVMVVWFTVIGVCGIGGIAAHPQILRALSPTYALQFVAGDFRVAFFALAAVVLAVTGAEALYADMGHFGRRAVTVAWLGLVLPACALSYLGQGASLLGDETVTHAPFFLLAPEWARLPMVVLATAATVIASQAVIAGVFSVASQAGALGFLPRLRIVHTSASRPGQIYVPLINATVAVAVVILVVSFGSSAALAYAYGMAVTGTITITTLLFFYVARKRWHTPLWLVITGGTALCTVDLLFLAANTTKLVHGAWLPLAIALASFTVMMTWQKGRTIVTRARHAVEGSQEEFLDELSRRRPPVQRVPGTAVFLTRNTSTAPLALRLNVAHNRVLHERAVILSITTLTVPHAGPAELTVERLDGAGIVHVGVSLGYMDNPDVPAILRSLGPTAAVGHHTDDGADSAAVSYFLSKLELRAGKEPTMAHWRKRLFIATSLVAHDAAEHFGLPSERTVFLGSRIEI